MRKLLFGFLMSASLSTFAADVCQVWQSSSSAAVSCNGVEWKHVGEAASKVLKEKLDDGYKIHSSSAIDKALVYTLIKD